MGNSHSSTRIAIITDSVAQIPHNLVEEWNIRVVPMEVSIEGEKYHDGVDLQSEALYRRMRQDNNLRLSTGSPSAGDFYQVFLDALKAGAECVLYVGLTSRLSSTFSAAEGGSMLVREELGQRQIVLYDTRIATIAQGFLVLEAARMAAEGANTDQIIEHLNQERQRVGIIAVLETLDYLSRGGRIGKAAYMMGSAIHIHPMVSLDEGGAVASAGMCRSYHVALEKMVDYVEHRVAKLEKEGPARQGHSLKVAVMHADTLVWAEKLQQLVVERLHPDEVFLTDFTPVMAVHTGPGLLGLAYHFK